MRSRGRAFRQCATDGSQDHPGYMAALDQDPEYLKLKTNMRLLHQLQNEINVLKELCDSGELTEEEYQAR